MCYPQMSFSIISLLSIENQLLAHIILKMDVKASTTYALGCPHTLGGGGGGGGQKGANRETKNFQKDCGPSYTMPNYNQSNINLRHFPVLCSLRTFYR